MMPAQFDAPSSDAQTDSDNDTEPDCLSPPQPRYPLAIQPPLWSSRPCPPSSGHASACPTPLSREPSLPSIMSLPRTCPPSPESSPLPQHIRNLSISSAFAKRQYPRTSVPLNTQPNHQRSLSPASNRLSRRLLAGGAGRLPSSLRTFEDGIRHYERVRSPSLRGHSRRGSWSADLAPPPPPSPSPARSHPLIDSLLSPSLTSSQNSKNWSLKEWCSDHGSPQLDVSTAEIYDFDIGDQVGEETLQPIKVDDAHSDYDSERSWSDNEAYDEDAEDGFDSDCGPGMVSSKELPRSVRIFKVGERVGVGTMHQGHRVRDLFEAGPGNGRRLSMGNDRHGLGTGLLEIVRQIGVGSYAVVYLVREVLHDPDLAEHSAAADHSLPTNPFSTSLIDALSETPRASDGFANMISSAPTSQPPRRRRRHRGEPDQVIYGRDFALKCLCKRDLSDEHLLLQRGEAELHRALPMHENIVALHRALETPNWLFLVIEYCPGQDLFYWLEQARDSQDLESLASRASSVSQQLCPPHQQNGLYTPPVSTLFPPSTSTVTPLSTRLPFPCPSPPPLSPKPINLDSQLAHPSTSTALPFNTPPSPSLLASKAHDEMLSRRRLRLISRMFVQMCEAVEACHRVGVCHRDIKPENFIVVDSRRSRSLNSKPVSFVPVRDSSPTPGVLGLPSSVVVKITDWGLGTSSSACEDFDCGSKPYMAYECRNNLSPTYDPVQADVWSLGIVLLNLLYHRCPWADPTLADPAFVDFRRAPIAFFHDRFEGMTPEVATFLATKVFCEVGQGHPGRVTAGELGRWSQNLLDHMGGGQLHASVSMATIALSPSSARGSQFTDRRSASDRKISMKSSGGPSKRSSQLFHAILLPHSVPEDVSPLDSAGSNVSPSLSATPNPPCPYQPPHRAHPSTASPLSLNPMPGKPATIERESRIKLMSHMDPSLLPPGDLEKHAQLCESQVVKEKLAQLELGSTVAVMTDDLESVTSAGKQRRRKRGARKGRKAEAGKRVGCDTAPVSPAEGSDLEHHHLDDLAQASQILAREISQASKAAPVLQAPTSTAPVVKRKLNFTERVMEKFRDGGHPDFQAFAARAKAREKAYMGQSNGKNANTVSAPAQLQAARQTTSAFSSISHSPTTASTTSSSGSGWVSSSMSSSGHWTSASNRRERLQGHMPPTINENKPERAEGFYPRLDPCKGHNTHGSHPGAPVTVAAGSEPKTKLAALLTSFKRFNSTVANPGSGTLPSNPTGP